MSGPTTLLSRTSLLHFVSLRVVPGEFIAALGRGEIAAVKLSPCVSMGVHGVTQAGSSKAAVNFSHYKTQD